MKEFAKIVERVISFTRIVLLIFFFITLGIVSGCHKKTGVKPGGQLKVDKSKCKCKKKKGGIYSNVFIHSTTNHYLEYSAKVEIKG